MHKIALHELGHTAVLVDRYQKRYNYTPSVTVSINWAYHSGWSRIYEPHTKTRKIGTLWALAGFAAEFVNGVFNNPLSENDLQNALRDLPQYTPTTTFVPELYKRVMSIIINKLGHNLDISTMDYAKLCFAFYDACQLVQKHNRFITSISQRMIDNKQSQLRRVKLNKILAEEF